MLNIAAESNYIMGIPNRDSSESGRFREGNVYGSEFPVQQPQQNNPDIDSENTLKTGTTTVGLRTADGVILAADMRASIGGMVSSKTAKKIHQLHPTAATTISGGVSAAQALVSNVKAEVRLYETRRGKEMSMEALGNHIANLLRSGAFHVAIPLLGGVDHKGSHIMSYDPVGGITREDYAVSGSGSQYALGVLEQEYDSDLSLSEGHRTAIQSIKSAVARDTASGNGLRVAEITDEGVHVTVYEDMDAVPPEE